MLDKRFLVTTRPCARKENILFFKNYRITVLTDSLFRIEKSETGSFTDEATQTVWFRDMRPVEFSATLCKHRIRIVTGNATVVVDEKWERSFCVVNGKIVKPDNAGNLSGTYRTLDCCDGDEFSENEQKYRIRLETGVCSRSGVAVLDDSKSLLLNKNGELYERPQAGQDLYIFAYGHNYRAAVRALYEITGYTPLLPRYAFGNWWSRYHKYTAEEYLNQLDRLAEKNLPFTVATIDMDWHYSDYIDEELGITESGHREEKYGCAAKGKHLGWTGYTWNKNLFPDYKAFLQEIMQRNFKITLNLHPKDGIRYFEACYRDFCRAMGKPADDTPVAFDMADDTFINAYCDIVLKPYEKDGVAFWWIDWQQGTTSKKQGLDPLWALNHYLYLDNASNHKNGLILSRYCKFGSHRYPVGFSGDTVISYKTLRYLPYFTATASNAGYTWWSHDIGGHYFGEKNDEMYLRHVQYGVFSPIFRLHASWQETMTKEPVAYMNGTGEIISEYLRLRHRMIPMLYTANYATHVYGKPLIEPLYYSYPEEENAYKYKNEYFFADFLVAPITGKSVAKGLSRVKVWLPEGHWTDVFTGEEYTAEKGGAELYLYRWLNDIPVLAPDGAAFILSDEETGNSVDNPRRLCVDIFSGTRRNCLYEDGETGSATTYFDVSLNGTTLKTEIRTEGDVNVFPARREFKLKFRNVQRGRAEVLKNGKPHSFTAKTDGYLSVRFVADEPAAVYAVNVRFTPETGFEYAMRHSLYCIQRFEIKFIDKHKLYNDICNIDDKRDNVLYAMENPVCDGSAECIGKLAELVGLPQIYIRKLTEGLK